MCPIMYLMLHSITFKRRKTPLNCYFMLFILSPNFSDLRRYFIGFRRFILLVLKAENTCSSP